MYDVYLGGVVDDFWMREFREQISNDISVFDPQVDGYEDLSEGELANQVAKEMIHMEDECNIIVFYLNDHYEGVASLLEIGDCVGRGKPVIVCLNQDVWGWEKIRRYCGFRGVIVVETIEDLVRSVEEYLGQIELSVYEEEA